MILGEARPTGAGLVAVTAHIYNVAMDTHPQTDAHTHRFDSATPLGWVEVIERGNAITGINLIGTEPAVVGAPPTTLFAEAERQLREYLAGSRTEFNLPMAAQGTEFQRSVWAELAKIPYGETRTYGQIAASLNKPLASRAVGGANNKNPLGIVVPCHRVIGASGALVGYASGVSHKKFLLDLERRTTKR